MSGGAILQSKPELTDLAAVRWFVLVHPTEPWPVVLGFDVGKEFLCGYVAFTYIEGARFCRAAHCPEARIASISASVFNQWARERGLEVFVDLAKTENGLDWQSFERAYFAQGGSA